MSKKKSTIKEDIMRKQEEKKLSLFGSRDLIISSESKEAAEEDMKKLEIQPHYKRAILTGEMKKQKKDDPWIDVSARRRTTLHIIYALIKADYGYETILNIFTNEHLKCSWILLGEKDAEKKLRKEVFKAIQLIDMERRESDDRKIAIQMYNETKGINAEEKLRRISEYISQDLLNKKDGAGKGFIDEEKGIMYFFHTENKALMEIDREHVRGDFYYFIRDRYDIPRKKYSEIRARIATHINFHGEKIVAYKFAYFDKTKHVLYVSNHNNEVYKLDGKKIDVVDNGTDGVFFEFTPEYVPFDVDVENLEGANYFEKGFSPLEFNKQNSYLRKYLIDKTNFAEEKTLALTPENQKDLLVIYLYSLFFESMMEEKPIIVFIGRKASGKSTLSTAMGRILFGSRYLNRIFPDEPKDLSVVLGNNYYVVFDNVDHFIRKGLLDIICGSTGETKTEKRQLFTDRTGVSINTHVFMGFTTREAKFKREDLVTRLLLFSTQKIDKGSVIPKSEIYDDIEKNRNKIMAEVLVNLNSIVKLLKKTKDFKPRTLSRIADWEAFGIKVNRWFHWASYFHSIMEEMGAEKDVFALEDDYIYQVLEDIVINDEETFDCNSATGLYEKLSKRADAIGIKDFTRHYKSPRSIAQRLTHIKDELNRVMLFETKPVREHKTNYYFAPLEKEPEESEEKKLEKSGKKKKLDITKQVSRIRAKHKKTKEKKEKVPPEPKEKRRWHEDDY